MATALEEGKAVEVNEVDVATTAASGEAVELTAVERYLGATDEKVTARKVAFEALCGLSVSLAMVPEAVSFSFVAGVKPVVGMTAGWIVAAVTSLAGGRPAMICGATGAIAALVPTLVEEEGEEYLFYAVMLMGVIQALLGVFKAGGLVKLLPHPVMMGFCNGLAIIIGLAQLTLFKRPHEDDDHGDGHRRLSGGFGVFDEGGWISGAEAAWAATICIVAYTITQYFPKITKKVPPSLVAIVVATGVEHCIARPCGYKTQLVIDFADVKGPFPVPVWMQNKYAMPSFSASTFGKVVPYATVMAIVGLIESLMTLGLVDELTQTKGNPNRECLGQGLANFVCGVLGGMGGCATIGQAMMNVASGARLRVSGFFAGVSLLIITVGVYFLINNIPVAALAGVMFVIVVNTFEWVSLKIMFFSLCPAKLRAYVGERAEYKIRRADAFVILLVTIVTLFSDLAVAVITGCLFSAFMFAMETGNTLRCDTELVKDPKTGEVLRKIYTVRGPLFFGSVTQFLDLFNVMEDPVDNVLRFEDSPTAICDFSALEALNRLTHRYKRFDKSIQVEKLTCTMSTKLLEKGKNCVQFEYSPEAVEMLDSGLTNLTVVEAAKEDFQPDWQAPGAPSDEAEAEMVAGGGGTRSAASDLDAISSSRDLSEAPELGIGCCNAEA